ncbi:MAG TPA: 2-hydroxyacyl-CoA dehydratase family protein, partial [Smithellaceae bacterium]|nr:2-hydroxyacyl-CoA dehydratase family protein [Smithellaceae bacterium]
EAGLAGTTSGNERARGLFCYIDHYTTDARLWNFLDKLDISHMGSILFNFWQKDNVHAVGREDEGYRLTDGSLDEIIDSLADQMSRMPMVKQIRGPYDAPGMWLDDTLSAVNIMKPDFVVYMGTMGCRNTWGMVKPFVRDLERRGIPALYLYADSFDDRVQSWETVADKINEFLTVRGIMK